MKKFLTVFLALLSVLTLSACGGAEPAAAEIPWPREPVDISTPLTWCISAWPDRLPSTLRNIFSSSSGKKPRRERIG